MAYRVNHAAGRIRRAKSFDRQQWGYYYNSTAVARLKCAILVSIFILCEEILCDCISLDFIICADLHPSGSDAARCPPPPFPCVVHLSIPNCLLSILATDRGNHLQTMITTDRMRALASNDLFPHSAFYLTPLTSPSILSARFFSRPKLNPNR